MLPTKWTLLQACISTAILKCIWQLKYVHVTQYDARYIVPALLIGYRSQCRYWRPQSCWRLGCGPRGYLTSAERKCENPRLMSRTRNVVRRTVPMARETCFSCTLGAIDRLRPLHCVRVPTNVARSFASNHLTRATKTLTVHADRAPVVVMVIVVVVGVVVVSN